MKTLKTLSIIMMLTLSVSVASAQKTANTNIDKITTAYLGVQKMRLLPVMVRQPG